MNEKILESMDLAPIDAEYEIVNVDISNKEIATTDKTEFQTDFETVRQNLQQLIIKGTKSLEDLMLVAEQSQHPRAYEALNIALKNMADINKDLLGIHDKIKTPEQNYSDNSKNVTNNVFVGTTEQLRKVLSQIKNDNE